MSTLRERWPVWLRGPWAIPAAASAAWIVVWLVAIVARAHALAQWLSLWSWPVVQGCALAACVRVGLDPAMDPRIRRAWRMLALAVGMATVGDLIWLYFEQQGEVPFPSPAEPFYLVSYVPQLVGQLLLPATTRQGDRPRVALDLATVAVASGAGVWAGILGPLSATYAQDTMGLVFAAGPAVGNLVLLAGATIMMLRRPDPSTAGALLLLCASILVYVGSDLVYVAQSITQTYQPGTWVDFGWMAGPLLIGLAALRQRAGAGDPAQVARAATLLERGGLVLPLGAAAFGFYLMLAYVFRDASGGTAPAIGGAALCALVLARQIYTAAQNRRLAQELVERNQELEVLSMRDALTQVHNRGAFDGYLAVEWARAAREKKPLSLLMCDIDFFKKMNDSIGHQGGDECLRRVAHVVRERARNATDLVARYGGEEFAVILSGTRLADALVVARRIEDGIWTANIAHPTSPFGRVTLSIGVAGVAPGGGSSPKALVAEADQALYRAKANGRNRIESAPSPAAAEAIARGT